MSKGKMEKSILIGGCYHKYWIQENGEKVRNTEFDEYSGRILDLKERKVSAIEYFYNLFDEKIVKNISICVVPSHVAADTNNSGVAMLARKFAQNGRVDRVDFLLRKSTVDKLSQGGQRSQHLHKDSIKVNPHMSVAGEEVLLIDDVTTTGTSLYACWDILREAGARRVVMFALGKTI